MTVEQFIQRMSRPLFVWRMAKPAAFGNTGTQAQQRAARNKVEKAEKEIDLLIHEYMGVK